MDPDEGEDADNDYNDDPNVAVGDGTGTIFLNSEWVPNPPTHRSALKGKISAGTHCNHVAYDRRHDSWKQ